MSHLTVKILESEDASVKTKDQQDQQDSFADSDTIVVDDGDDGDEIDIDKKTKEEEEDLTVATTVIEHNKDNEHSFVSVSAVPSKQPQPQQQQQQHKEHNKKEIGPTKQHQPLPVWQQKAAHILANFRTGIALQQSQQCPQREQQPKPEERNEPKDETLIPLSLSPVRHGQTSKSDDPRIPTDEVQTKHPIQTDPDAIPTSSDSFLTDLTPHLSPNRTTNDTENKQLKQHLLVVTSPTGILDDPELLQARSNNDIVIDKKFESNSELSTVDTTNNQRQHCQKINIPTLQQQAKTDVHHHHNHDSESPTLQSTDESPNDDLLSPELTTNSSSSFLGASLLSSWARTAISPIKNTATDAFAGGGTDTDDDDQDIAHVFERHTYQKPTKCDICDGLLVGLWSQGLQCHECGMNVHRGEGCNGHTNCRAEALLQDGGCRKHRQQSATVALQCQNVSSSSSPSSKTSKTAPYNNIYNSNGNNFSEAIQQVRQLAREQPNFFQDVKAQIDRDVKSCVKSIIVSKGAEEQRTKSLLKFRNQLVVPLVALLDRIESTQQTRYHLGGSILAYAILFAGHLLTVLVVCAFTWMGLSLALWGNQPSNTTTNNNNNNNLHTMEPSLVYGHMAAIVYAFHLALTVLVWIVRRLVSLMHRKSKVLDQFLQEVFSLSAQDDLGMSVHQFAVRARLWSRRWTNSTLTMLVLSFVVYRWTHAVVTTDEEGTLDMEKEQVMTLLLDVSDASDESIHNDVMSSNSNFHDWWMIATTILLLPILTSTLRCRRPISTAPATTSNNHSRILLCLFVMQQALPSVYANDDITKNHNDDTSSNNHVTRIGFGSCHKNIKAASPPIWDVVDKDVHGHSQPLDAWLWLGDATYGPKKGMFELGPDSVESIQQGLVDLQTNRTIGYRPFLDRNPEMIVAGIPDDHDFGGNDMGDQTPDKLRRRDAWWDFLEYRRSSDDNKDGSDLQPIRHQPQRWNHDGMYHRVDLEGGRVRVLALDTRWFRESHCIPSAALMLPLGNVIACITRWFTSGLLLHQWAWLWGRKGCEKHSMLGEKQWNWLTNELLLPNDPSDVDNNNNNNNNDNNDHSIIKNTQTPDVFLILSSVQVWSTNPALEGWGQFPAEQERLWDLLTLHYSRGGAPVIFLSGDVHHAEVIGQEGYIEVTSSGLTHHCGQPKLYGQLCRPLVESFSAHRHSPTEYYIGHNYGRVEVDWKKRQVRVQVHDSTARVVLQTEPLSMDGRLLLPTYESLPRTLDGHLIPYAHGVVSIVLLAALGAATTFFALKSPPVGTT
ncbi:alkaline phosphatase D precursor [Nitzschia inconspicua]|uniref:Alkaline phosphatase D n=1 Tax=Nitzschia inconspicua TaxID=303405 RepID=A0A9K3LWS1_9STRA|nr:alkaline phosphatase D precursor [Nitzschia inconspicua]